MPPHMLPLVCVALRLLSGAGLVSAAALNAEQHPFSSSTPSESPLSPLPEFAGTLHRFTPSTPALLAEVVRTAEAHDLDVWQVAAGETPHVDIYASGDLPAALLNTPHTARNITLPSVHTQSRPPWDGESLKNTTFHDAYHPQPEVDAFVLALAREHPKRAEVIKLGHSAEGREMLGLKITGGTPSNTTKPKMGWIVLGPQHSREWVAKSSALYLAHALLSPANDPESLASLLDVYDFHVIPSPNPDGYVYTWETDRFWYKTRQIVGPGAQCIGIDMNRNWGYKWKAHFEDAFFGPFETSANTKKDKKEPADPCSHWYPGHRPFESAEVTNLANYLTRIHGIGKGAKGGIVGFLQLRSYGQMLAAPYSYSCDRLPKDAEDQMEALHGAAQAGRAVDGTPFVTGSLCELLYRAPGNILDYFYSTGGIKYTYTAFLRDTGTYGFALPPEWIRPVGAETGAMVRYLAGFVARQRGIEISL